MRSGKCGSGLKPLVYVMRVSSIVGISPLDWRLRFSWPLALYSLTPVIITGYYTYRLLYGHTTVFPKYKRKANLFIMRNSTIVLSVSVLLLYLNIFANSFTKSNELKEFIERIKTIEEKLSIYLIEIGCTKPFYKMKTVYFIVTVFLTRFVLATTIFNDFRPLDAYKILLEQYLFRSYIQDSQLITFLDVISDRFRKLASFVGTCHSETLLKELGKAHNDLCSLTDDVADYYSTHCLLSIVFNSLSILASCHTFVIEVSDLDDSDVDTLLMAIDVAVNILTIYLVSSSADAVFNEVILNVTDRRLCVSTNF